MHTKPQGLPVTEPFDLGIKQANKTKRIILVNNGLVSNENRVSTENIDQCNFNLYENNSKAKNQHFDSSFVQKPGNSSVNPPPFDRNLNYNKLFWKIYLENEIIVSEMKQCVTKSKDLQAQIGTLEHECQELEKSLQSSFKKETKKKNRRTANEIDKSFTCPYQNCNKNYGSDVSLNLHIKLKHNGGNKTEREKLARSIFLAKMNGEDEPEINLNLPPGFLESINKTKLLKEKSGKKERSATNDKDQFISDEKTSIGKNEASGKMETEESPEKQLCHDSNCNGIDHESNVKAKDTQELSRKTTNIIPSLILTRESIIPITASNSD